MAAQINTFDDISERLEEIVSAVRSKETSLERSLDLLDEAIELGSKAVDMVDTAALSEREAALIDGRDGAADAADGEPDAEGAADADAPAEGSESGQAGAASPAA